MKVYIAGPMTGYEHYNFPAFHRAAQQLRKRGYEVLNPADKETLEGTDLPDPAKLPPEWGGTNTNTSPAEVFLRDYEMILEAEAIVLLNGWEHSNGALRECITGQAMGKAIYMLRHDYSLKKLNPNWRFKVVLNWEEVALPTVAKVIEMAP